MDPLAPPTARDRELLEARALTEATMTALDRFGLSLSHEDLKDLVASLNQAKELLARFQADERPADLMAAMTVIDQVRQMLVRQPLQSG